MLMLAEVNVVTLVVVLLFIGGLGVLVNKVGDKINKTVLWLLNAALIVVAVLFLLDAFGIWDLVKGTKVPRF